MIAIPSVCGNGLTGWSSRLKDKEVADLASMKSNRGCWAPRRGGFAFCDLNLDFVTRSLTMRGRGAFDARPALGRVGNYSRRAEFSPRLTPAPLAEPPSRSDSTRFSLLGLALKAMSLREEALDIPRRLVRTTMRTTPRSHRDRPASGSQFGCRIGSSSGKGVRAA